ncbi:hypothetical protein QQ045_015618 [Rhodiola kirilowii]
MILECHRGKDKYKWELRASKKKNEGMWRTTKYEGDHTCEVDIIPRDNAHFKKHFIGMDIRNLIQEKLRFSPYTVQAFMREKEESFEKPPTYMDMLQESNPGSIVQWDTSTLESWKVMEANDVIWTPYRDEILGMLNPMCVAVRDSWRAEVPLICFNITEWHYHSLALCQFGWRQPEPALPPQSHRDMHMSKRRTSEPIDEEMQVHMNLWDNHEESVIAGEPNTDGLYLDAYYTWYYIVTRKRI